MADFKIRVVENIGSTSIYAFGKPGTELLVDNGCLIDFEESVWCNGTAGYKTVADVNEYFGDEDIFQTVFELVEES